MSDNQPTSLDSILEGFDTWCWCANKECSGSESFREAKAALERLLIQERNRAYETALYDIETIVTLQGPKIKATDAMRLIHDRIAELSSLTKVGA